MADMITRCPQCATAFRITAAHLKLAQGSVRCGACFTIFNALENLSERTTQNSPASNLADDFLISDHMGIEDDVAENNAESANKSSLFERVEKAKALPEKTEEADESWAIALLSEEGLNEPLVAEDEFIEEEPSFRPFQIDASAKPIELSDDFLKATKSADLASQPVAQAEPTLISSGEQSADASGERLKDAEAFVTSLAEEHPELNPEDLKDLHEALQNARVETVVAVKENSTAHVASRNNAPSQSSSSHNAHLIERIELDALEVTFRHRKGLSAQFWWGTGCLAALLLLLIQVAIIKMPQWRYDTPLSGVYTLACQKLTCPKDNRVDASKIQTKSLLVREHPTHPGAFAVDAVIVNKASFVQPFPRLILSFRNLQNQLINERIFLPAEYLGGEMAGEQNMPIKQEIRIGLEIVDPGNEAVSYNLSAD
jgi:predicted Zn finger-like uncharacterized protein